MKVNAHAAVFLIRYAPQLRAAVAKLNPASRDNAAYQATGEWGTHIPDLFGGVFKSDAEKQVDEMLRVPTAKTVVKPTGAAGSGYEHSPGSFEAAKSVPAPVAPWWPVYR